MICLENIKRVILVINSSPDVVFKCDFKMAINSPDRYKKMHDSTANIFLRGMFNYLSNLQINNDLLIN